MQVDSDICYSLLSDLLCDVDDWLNLLQVFGSKTRASKPWQTLLLLHFLSVWPHSNPFVETNFTGFHPYFLRTEFKLYDKSKPTILKQQNVPLMYLPLIISLVCINSFHFNVSFIYKKTIFLAKPFPKGAYPLQTEGFLITTTFHNIMIARSKVWMFILWSAESITRLHVSSSSSIELPVRWGGHLDHFPSI